MGCLLCGKPIGMVRKFTDSEFCSNEHRRDWAEARESAFVDRLRDARARIERARSRYHVRKTTPPPPPAPEAAPFFAQAPAEIGGSPSPTAFGPFLSTAVKRPELEISPARYQMLAGFQSDLPWPAWNAGLRSFGELGLETLACSNAFDYLRTAAKVFGDWKPEIQWPSVPDVPHGGAVTRLPHGSTAESVL